MHGWQYISKRLVTETVQADQAGRRVNVTASAGFGGLEATSEVREPDFGNVFELAERTTEILASRVRKIDDDGLAPGDVVRGVFNLHEADFAVWRKWDRNDSTEVASFVVAERYPWGRVFIGLFGSAHNWTLDTETRTRTGRPASDARGLYELMSDSLGTPAGNEGLSSLVSVDREAREASSASRFQDVLTSVTGSPFYANRKPREVLFVIHDLQHDAHLRLDDTNGRRLATFDLAVIGAPIWVRDAPTSAMTPDSDGKRPYQLGSGRTPDAQLVAPTYAYRDAVTRRDIWAAAPAHGYTEQWREWDRIASDFADFLVGRADAGSHEVAADHIAREVDRQVTSEERWQDLCRWFSDQAQSFGGAAVELHVHPRRRFTPWRFDGSEYVASGRFGRPIHASDPESWGSDSALVLTDGTVVEASEDGFIEGDGDVEAVGHADARKWAIAMLLQAARWRASPLE